MGSQAKHFRNPHDLPTKICKRCGRPFHWRKKWARSWPEVQYCSVACRTQRRLTSPANLKDDGVRS